MGPVSRSLVVTEWVIKFVLKQPIVDTVSITWSITSIVCFLIVPLCVRVGWYGVTVISILFPSFGYYFTIHSRLLPTSQDARSPYLPISLKYGPGKVDPVLLGSSPFSDFFFLIPILFSSRTTALPFIIPYRCQIVQVSVPSTRTFPFNPVQNISELTRRFWNLKINKFQNEISFKTRRQENSASRTIYVDVTTHTPRGNKLSYSPQTGREPPRQRVAQDVTHRPMVPTGDTTLPTIWPWIARRNPGRRVVTGDTWTGSVSGYHSIDLSQNSSPGSSTSPVLRPENSEGRD